MEELKRRLEQLIGAKPAAPIDASQKAQVEAETQRLANRREKVAAAGGELLGAAMNLVGELVSGGAEAKPETVRKVRASLDDVVQRDTDGRLQVQLTLPDAEALDGLAKTLAKLLVSDDS